MGTRVVTRPLPEYPPGPATLPPRPSPGWGGVLQGWSRELGLWFRCLRGCWGPCASFVPHFPSSQPGRGGGGPHGCGSSFFPWCLGGAFPIHSAGLRVSSYCPPAPPPPAIFSTVYSDKSFRTPGKNVGSPENLGSMVQNRNLLAHVFLNKRLLFLLFPKAKSSCF